MNHYSNMSTLEYFLTCFAIAGVLWVFTLMPNMYQHTNKPIDHVLVQGIWSPSTPTLADKKEWCIANKECTILARTGYFEARSESLLSIWSVMSVVMNRVSDKRWPNTISGVVNYPYAFSYTHDGSTLKGINDKKSFDKALIAAYHVMHGDVESPVGDSTHYFEPTQANPSWAKKLEYVATVDSHKFYR